MKVKMLARHTHPNGKKLEQGLIYDFPQEYARELISHGLATVVIEIPPVTSPGFAKVSHKRATRFNPKGKKS
jgi:hypothetical protein